MNRSLKEARYQELSETFSHMTDGLGTPIDTDILDLVIVLNALNFPTDASCAGHPGEYHATPYVDLETPVGDDGLREAIQALREAEHQEVMQQLPEDEIDRLRWHAHSLFHQLNIPALQMRQRLTTLFIRFYHEHQSDYDAHISVKHHLYQGCIQEIRIENQGAAHYPLLPPVEQEKILRTYQHEMQCFTHFLQHFYFDEYDEV